jgi:hypothetical protein
MSRRTSPAIEVARPSPTSDPEDILEARAGGAPRSADPFADQALDLVGRALGLCSSSNGSQHPFECSAVPRGCGRAPGVRGRPRERWGCSAALETTVRRVASPVAAVAIGYQADRQRAAREQHLQGVVGEVDRDDPEHVMAVDQADDRHEPVDRSEGERAGAFANRATRQSAASARRRSLPSEGRVSRPRHCSWPTKKESRPASQSLAVPAYSAALGPSREHLCRNTGTRPLPRQPRATPAARAGIDSWQWPVRRRRCTRTPSASRSLTG